jgi:hypothetical protein
MDFLKQAIMYIVLAAAFWGTIAVVKALSRVQVPSGYSDVDNLEEYASYRVDRNVGIRQLRAGDPISYRLGKAHDHEVYFGWVAGVPGDDVAIAKGEVTVNGKAVGHGDKLASAPDCGPLRVPANHVFVVSDHHDSDSLACGPIPAVAIHGRLGSLP